MSRLASNKILPVLLTVLVFAGGALGALELTHTTHYFSHKTKPAATASQSTKGEPAATSENATKPASARDQNNTDTPQPGDSKDTQATTTNLLQPTGNFVSAHKNVPANATLSSVCNTTAGASCKITFTMNGVVKSLAAQTADRGGATYWNSWTPASIGLTPGSWHIQAVANLNNQTSTADDALSLDIAR